MTNGILNMGIDSDTLSQDVRGIRLLNTLLLISFFTTIVFIVFNIYNDNKLSIVISECVLVVSFLIAFILNSRKKNSLAKFLYFMSFQIIIPLYSFWLDKGKNQEYFHFILIILLLMFYRKSGYFYILYVLNLFLFYAPQVFLQVYPEENYSYLYPLALFVSLFLVIDFFISDQIKTEALLIKSNSELSSLNIEKNNLIGVVSHDLRSPLNNIKAMLPIISNDPNKLTKEQNYFLKLIGTSTDRMSEMVGTILNVQAIESNRLNPNLETCDLGQIVEKTVKGFEIVAQNKKIEVLNRIDLKKHFAEVDENYLILILENLISNAIKFSTPNTNIYLKMFNENNKQKIMIKDEGPGFNSKDKTKLFSQFEKLSATPTANETSTGLGLSIAKRYTDAMNGKIWCESTKGKGAEFFVEFENVYV